MFNNITHDSSEDVESILSISADGTDQQVLATMNQNPEVLERLRYWAGNKKRKHNRENNEFNI